MIPNGIYINVGSLSVFLSRLRITHLYDFVNEIHKKTAMTAVFVARLLSIMTILFLCRPHVHGRDFCGTLCACVYSQQVVSGQR